MANNLLDTHVTASAQSPSVLERLDPPSPTMTVFNESFVSSEPRGVSLAQELENLGLSGMTNDNEEEMSTVIAYILTFDILVRHFRRFGRRSTIG